VTALPDWTDETEIPRAVIASVVEVPAVGVIVWYSAGEVTGV
jgi:hypothetical protein